MLLWVCINIQIVGEWAFKKNERDTRKKKPTIFGGVLEKVYPKRTAADRFLQEHGAPIKDKKHSSLDQKVNQHTLRSILSPSMKFHMMGFICSIF